MIQLIFLAENNKDPSIPKREKVSKGWEMSHDRQIWACVKYLKRNFSRLQIWRISDCLRWATERRRGWERADRGAPLTLYLRTITAALLPSFRQHHANGRLFESFYRSAESAEGHSINSKVKTVAENPRLRNFSFLPVKTKIKSFIIIFFNTIYSIQYSLAIFKMINPSSSWLWARAGSIFPKFQVQVLDFCQHVPAGKSIFLPLICSRRVRTNSSIAVACGVRVGWDCELCRVRFIRVG